MKRKLIIAVLFFLTAVLAGVSIYIGYTLTQDKPDDSSVAGTCGECLDGTLNRCCKGGDWAGTCSDSGAHTWLQGYLDCNGGGGGGCSVSTLSADKTSFTLNSECSSADKIKVYERDYSGTISAFYPTCVTDDTNGTLTRQEDATAGGSYDSYKIGKCVQIDAFKADGTFIIGVCRCEPEEDVSGCNDTCTTKSDCPGNLTCPSGKCRNPNCPSEASCVCSITPAPICGDGECGKDELCELDSSRNISGRVAYKTCPEETALPISYECRSDCTYCGDGVLNGSEVCDFNSSINTCPNGQTCNTSCICEGPIEPQAECGDEQCNPGEFCETTQSGAINCQVNPPTSLATTCRADCTFCGDGVLNGNEVCDYNSVVNTCGTNSICNTSCTCETSSVICGDHLCNQESEYCETTTGGSSIECPGGTPLSEDCRVDCTYCGDGIVQTGEACDYGATPDTCDTDCTPIEEPPEPILQCVEMTSNIQGSEPIGEGQVVAFQVVLEHSVDQMPYANNQVKLRVSSSSSDDPLGEDANNAGTNLVSPYNSGPRSTTEWVYAFAWRAIDLTDGSYDVEVSFDNGQTWEDLEACTDTFVFAQDIVVEEPEFIIVKSGSSVCSTTQGAQLSYTLTVTNMGPGTGIIDTVIDELAEGISDSWVTSIDSSNGMDGDVGNGVITWTGTTDQRTFTQGQEETFTYRILIPFSALSQFVEGVLNVATVVWGEDQSRYNYYLEMDCQDIDLPATGFYEQMPWILGILTVIVGMFAYKMGVGEQTLKPLLASSYKRTNDALIKIGYNTGFGEILRRKKQREMQEKFGERKDEDD